MNYWETPEYRAKYNAKQLKASLAKGHALPNANGDASYPVEDAEDLDNAIHAVGRGGADHDAIRQHIMQQAKRLGLSSKIPDNWNADGSLKQSNSDGRKPHHRSLPLAPEYRFFAVPGLELRTGADGSGDVVTVTGAPIVYGQGYTVVDMLGEFEERMHPGVASDVLSKNADVRFLFDHAGLPLARTTAGTMTLTDGDSQLRFSADLDLRQQLANDLVIAIQRGDITQMSCGFIVGQDDWNSDYTERDVFRFQQMFDVSAVTYPASPTTSIEIAQRMMMGTPVESRARVRKVWQISKDLRAGKPVSADQAAALSNALESLHAADDALATVQNAHVATRGHLNGLLPGYDNDPDASEAGPVTDPTASQDATGSRADETVTETTEAAPRGMSAAALRMQLQVAKAGGKVAAAKRSKKVPPAMAPADANKPFEPAPYKADPDENVTCPNCHKQNDGDARFCDQCGFKLVGANGVQVA